MAPTNYPDMVLLLPGQTQPHVFKVLFKNEDYCFADCPTKPELRGFFTKSYAIAHIILAKQSEPAPNDRIFKQ